MRWIGCWILMQLNHANTLNGFPTWLNKTYSKDSYPLPKINQSVDAITSYKMMSFLDFYYRYNQIKMNESDKIHMVFNNERGLYCYKVMPFRLRTIRATYQRLISRMFSKLRGRKVEAYIDDKVIKSKESRDNIKDEEEVFDIFRMVRIMLNSLKYAFGISSEKLLGHVVSKRGIDPSPTQMRKLSKIEESKTV